MPSALETITVAPAAIAVVGHVCLDIIPQFGTMAAGNAPRIEPGRLYQVGPATLATGGAVSNTGLALHKLGLPVRLVGKLGDDLFGAAVRDIFRHHWPALADGMLTAPGEPTSYSVVVSPPGVDRSFLHCPGANDTFAPSEIDLTGWAGVEWLHFGYPPIMRQVYADGGRALAVLFAQAQARGMRTSLDMCVPDPQSAAGEVDWPAWLRRVLPHVDLFVPSFDEILFMLDRLASQRWSPATSVVSQPDLLRQLADQLLGWGSQVVVLKLGAEGLYLRAADREPRGPWHDGWSQWRGAELLAPCFDVTVAGTTGAGDSTIAGLLAAVRRGDSPAAALQLAVAVGACSVESADATSGIRPLAEVERRITAGWPRRRNHSPPPPWRWQPAAGVWQRN